MSQFNLKKLTGVRPPDYEFRLKLIIVGCSGVGKTAIMLRFCEDWFNEIFMNTIGVDFKVKYVDVDG